MTKKDYIKFVDVWKNSIKFIDSATSSFQYIDPDTLYQELCKIFADDNPNFNEQIFRDAIESATWEQKKESGKLPLWVAIV